MLEESAPGVRGNRVVVSTDEGSTRSLAIRTQATLHLLLVDLSLALTTVGVLVLQSGSVGSGPSGELNVTTFGRHGSIGDASGRSSSSIISHGNSGDERGGNNGGELHNG